MHPGSCCTRLQRSASSSNAASAAALLSASNWTISRTPGMSAILRGLPRLAQHAQPVLVSELAQIGRVEASVGKRRDHARQARHVADDAWHGRTVEVGAEPDVLHAHAVGQVAEVLDD